MNFTKTEDVTTPTVEHDLSHHKCFAEYLEMFESTLEAFVEEEGSTSADFFQQLSDCKENPLGAQVNRPEGTDEHPKGATGRPESSQSKQNELQRHSKEGNKSQNYIHLNKIYANSQYTAIQRPASITSRPLYGGALGVCTYSVYVYIVW